MRTLLGSFCLVILLIESICGEPCQPYGVRLALGMQYVDGSASQILTVRFNTEQQCLRSFIEVYPESSQSLKVLCSSTLLTFDTYASYVQECTVTHLQDGEHFEYSVYGWSGREKDSKISYKEKNIPAVLPQDDGSFRMVVLGDWGKLELMKDTYETLEAKFNEVIESELEINTILILGDVAYDLESNNGKNYQDFIRMLSQVSCRWPLIFPPGNHQRLTDTDRLVYQSSFQTYDIEQDGVSVLHLPHFNLLLYDPYEIIFLNKTGDQLFQTFKEEIDSQVGLTIVAAHYPFLCSGPASDCIDKPQKQKRFFDYMISHNVPLYMGAHYHSYERNYPVKIDGSFVYEQDSITWKASQQASEMKMISMINGIAGSDTLLDEASDGVKPFTAAYSYLSTGFGIFQINQTALVFRELITTQKEPVDQFTIYLDRQPSLSKHSLRISDQ